MTIKEQIKPFLEQVMKMIPTEQQIAFMELVDADQTINSETVEGGQDYKKRYEDIVEKYKARWMGGTEIKSNPQSEMSADPEPTVEDEEPKEKSLEELGY